jgi:2-methylisocitrate lyase-like PEP mutase family enzyme
MNKNDQIRRAEVFLALHHDPSLLVLPNVWDPLGARMLEALGFPAVATASAAVAYSLGYGDGQLVTDDFESGYAEEPGGVRENVRRVVETGAVGINLEDSAVEGGPLFDIEAQCRRIEAARAGADDAGVPLVINARTDVFLGRTDEDRESKVTEVIERAQAYLEAGADCVYPIPIGDVPTLRAIVDAVRAPVNAFASASTAPMRELEEAGVSRLSVGPGLIKAALGAMKAAALDLKSYGGYDAITTHAMTSEEIQIYVRKERMKPDERS